MAVFADTLDEATKVVTETFSKYPEFEITQIFDTEKVEGMAELLAEVDQEELPLFDDEKPPHKGVVN